MLFQSKACESFISKTIKRSLSAYHLADTTCKNTKTTFHFQPKLFNVLNNIHPFTTQVFGRIIVSNPLFLLISDLNLTKAEYDVWVGDLERLSQIFPHCGGCLVLQTVFEDTFIARQVSFMFPSVLL